MDTAATTGRIVGALMLLQMVGGVTGNFVLTAPVFAEPGFLVNAAGHSTAVSLAALTGLATSALSLAVAIIAGRVIRLRGEAWAAWLVALATANLALAAIEQVTLLSMLSLSQAFVSAAAPDEALFQALRGVVAAARNWTHYIHLLIGGSVLVVLFGALWRLSLLPRVLAGAGVVATLLQMATLALPIFGYRVLFPLLAPLGLVMLASAAWLVWRGFREPAARTAPAQA